MAVTSGFFNAIEHDRLYNAEDVGSLLDGIITDGILNTYGSHFNVTHGAGDGLNITVGSGRGWFKNTWILNDDNLTLTAEANISGSPRIDTVVIDVNLNDDVRADSILIVKGSSSRPVLIDEAAHKQYPIADLTIDATGSDITTVTDRRDESYATSALMIKPYYPVGAIYMTVDADFDPHHSFGGNWEMISGRFLIGCGGSSGFKNGDTGGSWLHTISTNNLPAHTHEINITTSGNTAEISTHRMDDHTTGNTVMGWPQQTKGLPSLDMSNYLPAAWNYPYGYQGSSSLDVEPTMGPSPYATSQTALTQSPHYHQVQGNTGSAGNNTAMDIKPPYLAVYMWKRIS
jgi:microcystin-dependent protein